ncbi:vegetative incompatibility protein HET-E-1, putative [Rhizoctonia solani AG-3 Rhs1AP]|uniref:Vegetative incompatibility protein HET-E-1, putative n=1 Tax=Rhizoctonia solani AG-3 Rhs1AP TaxID=1086054 RepID=X8JBW6_9AGAM|nr:vegetative incompatibility protein HET-E-1, putative [Rhizoctonia solani AG-3 Rhs1AP]
MSPDPPASDPEQIRYCITDIKLQPSTVDPNCKISAKLFVDNELICNFPWLDNTQPLRWARLLLCHVSPSSKMVLKLSRNLKGKQRSFNFPTYQVSDVDEGTGETTLDHPELVWIVTIKSLTPTVAEQLFRDELDQLGLIDGIYDSLKPNETTKFLFKIALKFASISAEALSERNAKFSFLIIVRTWELLEQQAQVDEVIQEILQGLVCIREVVEVLDQASSSTITTAMNQCEEPIVDILALLEDASVYIFNRIATSNPSRISYDQARLNDTYDVEAYLNNLTNLQKAFHASWSPGITSSPGISTIDSSNALDDELPTLTWEDYEATLDEPVTKHADPYEILNLLKPTNPGGYDPDQACLEGTRQAVLDRIITWSQNRKNPESFMWISGQAGIGKTSIAASLCQRLDGMRVLAGSFFCQRNDPNLSDPLRLINNIVHDIASRCPPYAHVVANAIRANRTLCTAHLSIRYEGLVKGPLKRLRSLSAPAPLVVVVDALDECGDWSSRKRVLHMLYNTSQLVPWLKLIFTARPEGDLLKEFRKHFSHEPVVNLQAYDASNDISAYIRAQLGEVAQEEQWPDAGISQLCTMAQGLFLWAALTTNYIKQSTIPALSRFQQVLDNRKSPVTDHFDKLYTKALDTAMNDHNDDTKEAYTRCIGAILASSEYEPISIPDLQYLMVAGSQIGQGTLERVITSLGPLVYLIDGQYVRFYHSSFRDFSTSTSRSHEFHVSLEHHIAKLANCCLEVMQQDLRFNICRLRTSYLLNSEVPDLKHRVHSHIGSALKYACSHWINYFTSSPNQALVGAILKFLEAPQLMYWIEVLSLLGRIDIAVTGLSELRSLKLKQCVGWRLFVSRAKDAQQFLLSFYDPIVASTPHLYISALAFSPTGSLTARKMRPHFPNTLTITKGANSTWHPCIKTITHPHAIQSLSISPDGLKVITGYPDGSLCIWDKQTGTRASELLAGHKDLVTCVAFSPNGKLAASSSRDTTIRVWVILEKLKIVSHELTGHSAAVNSIAFSPNSAIIASGSSDKTIRLWDSKAMRPILEPYLGHSSRVSCVAFSSDGKKLVSGSWDKTIRIWSMDLVNLKLADNPILINGHSDAVTCVAISLDGSKIVSGSVDKTMNIWEVQTGSKMASSASPPKHSDTVTSVAFSPNGKLFMSSSLDGAIQLWDATTFTAYTHPFGHFSPVNATAFSPDGSHVVSGSTDMTTRVWEISACPKIMAAPMVTEFAGHSSSITSIAVSIDGTCLVSGSNDRTVRMWDAESGAPIGDPFTGHSNYVYCVAISSNGTRILSGSADRTLKVWDTNSRSIVHSYQHTHAIRCTAFSPDGVLIAFASDDYKVHFIDAASGKAIGDPLEGHSNIIYSIAFSPDGTYIATASADRTACLWSAVMRNCLAKPFSGHSHGVRSVAFSPCGTQLASGTDNGIVQLWDVNTSSTVLTLTGNSVLVNAVSFSLDGSYITSASTTNPSSVRFWDAKTGQSIGQPIAASNHPQCISFSPDGGYVLFGCNDYKIRINALDASIQADTSSNNSSGGVLWPSNPHSLAPHPHCPGWVSRNQKSLVFWLPAQYQQPAQLWDTHKQVPHPQTFLDYSKFVHGTAWTGVARKS